MAALARQIDADYAGREPTLIIVLKGAMIFAADLMRRLTIPIRVEFIGAASYGNAMQSSGAVALAGTEGLALAGRDVLVVEDIIDSGVTGRALLDRLRERDPSTLALCALLRKQSPGSVAVEIRYTGFTIPDRFVVGYGMDYAERYRNLPDICVLTLQA